VHLYFSVNVVKLEQHIIYISNRSEFKDHVGETLVVAEGICGEEMFKYLSLSLVFYSGSIEGNELKDSFCRISQK